MTCPPAVRPPLVFDHADKLIGVIMRVSEAEGLTEKNFRLIIWHRCYDRTVFVQEEVSLFTTY